MTRPPELGLGTTFPISAFPAVMKDEPLSAVNDVEVENLAGQPG